MPSSHYWLTTDLWAKICYVLISNQHNSIYWSLWVHSCSKFGMDFHEFRFARSAGLVVFFRFLWLKKINTHISGIPPIGTPIRGIASLTLWSSASLRCYHTISSLLQATLWGTETQELTFSEQYCWSAKFSGKWCCDAELVFRIKQSWSPLSRRKRHQNPLTHRELFTRWHGYKYTVTGQTMGVNVTLHLH